MLMGSRHFESKRHAIEANDDEANLTRPRRGSTRGTATKTRTRHVRVAGFPACRTMGTTLSQAGPLDAAPHAQSHVYLM
jgi:hypothetical protein